MLSSSSEPSPGRSRGPSPDPLVHSCAGCGRPGPSICPPCRFALGASHSTAVAPQVLAAFEFSGVVRSLVHSLKYRNRRHIARELATAALHRIGPAAFVPVRVVTWAPTSRAHRRQRGYDQAELLARAIAQCLGVPCRRLLFRAHGDAQSPQTGRSRAERLRGIEFVVRPGLARAFGGAPGVLLIDDVVTTGATLTSARRALLAGGAGNVVALAIAAAPSNPNQSGQPVQSSPASLRTRATASAGSTSTCTPTMPTASAATTLVGASSKKAVRPAAVPSLDKAS